MTYSIIKNQSVCITANAPTYFIQFIQEMHPSWSDEFDIIDDKQCVLLSYREKRLSNRALGVHFGYDNGLLLLDNRKEITQ